MVATVVLLVRLVAALVAVVALLAIGWGVALLVTLQDEFEPRGSVGIVLVGGGTLLLALAVGVLRALNRRVRHQLPQ